MKQRIIDTHAHPVFDNKILKQSAKEASVDFNLKGLFRDFKKHNIVKAVALPISTYHFTNVKTHFTVKNSEIKKLVLETKEKFIGGCTINPIEYEQDDIIALEDEIKKGIFKAIKLFHGYEFFYPNQEECTPIYELAKRNKIPVLFHTGDVWGPRTKLKYTHPLNVDEVAVSFPDVKFVLCHLGNPWITDAVEVLYKNNNVYADLSGFVLGKEANKNYCDGRLKAIMDGIYYSNLIIDKLMFGTDYPLTNYDFYIKFISKLDLSRKEFNRIFFDNAAKFFNIKC